MHFGIYHLANEFYPKEFEESLTNDWIDTYIVSSAYRSPAVERGLERIAEAGKQSYIYTFDLLFEQTVRADMVDVGEEYHARARLKADYLTVIEEMANYLKSRPYYGSIAGFYLDEPLLLGVSLDEFEEATGAVRAAFPDKRFFCCFSIAGVAPDVWTTGDVKPITPKAARHLTDAAFDMYSPFDETYAAVVDQMKRRLGNEEIKIWFIPSVMNYRGNKTEDYCIGHLNGCYELLIKEKNRGGLMCFTYRTFPVEEEQLGNVGLDSLLGQKDVYWNRLEREIKRIGKLCLEEKE